ncbi:hypothetical protein QJS10_CPA01g01370 [Acorus calamus]|uniref:Uncharacterized protein n=1 Tax=Acorus calamus TaxID=4465 RepID=A0AAV9FF52_ACOCL|nr:hypothetical protein QJS10_CPA01g01370 [Acorus calamus]
MGCNPLGKKLSTLLNKIHGKGSKSAHIKARASPDRPRARSMARSVTFSNSPIIITPPTTTDAAHPPTPPPPRSKSKSVTFSHTDSPIVITPSAAPWLPPTRTETVAPIASVVGKTMGTVQTVRAGFAAPEQDQQYQSWRSEPVYLQREQVFGWYVQPEAMRGAEREEQLCYYYPTPAHNGNYGIAADANRFTTIFSDENPNACSIV